MAVSKTRRRGQGQRRVSRGGFYPSVMYGVAAAGPAFVTSCVFQGYRLVSNNNKRMASRRSAGTKRRPLSKRTRRSRRT